MAVLRKILDTVLALLRGREPKHTHCIFCRSELQPDERHGGVCACCWLETQW